MDPTAVFHNDRARFDAELATLIHDAAQRSLPSPTSRRTVWVYGAQNLAAQESDVEHSHEQIYCTKNFEFTVSHNTYRPSLRPLIVEDVRERSLEAGTACVMEPFQDHSSQVHSPQSQDLKGWLPAATERSATDNYKMQIHPSRLLMLSQPENAPFEKKVDMIMHETKTKQCGNL